MKTNNKNKDRKIEKRHRKKAIKKDIRQKMKAEIHLCVICGSSRAAEPPCLWTATL